jgi:chaperonin GroES
MRCIAVGVNVFAIREDEVKERNGLILPEQSIQPTHQGKIVSVGKLVQDRKSIAEGRIAIWNQHAGFSIEVDGVEYVVLKEHEIIGLI